MLHSTLLIFACSMIMASSEYIYYEKLDRHCIPYYDCEPGNQIVPCIHPYGNDLCIPCQSNTVQPDMISSTGNTNSTSCFKPKQSECLAYDITYRRELNTNAFCETLKGCKCKTDSCYYGDPCLCNKADECAENQTLASNGTCVNCPPNTFRMGSGCGPCRHLSGSLNTNTHTTTTIQKTLEVVVKTFSLSSKTSTSFTTIAPSTKAVSSSLIGSKEHGERNYLFIIAVILSTLVIVLAIGVIIFCIRRTGIRQLISPGVCWSHGNGVADNLQNQDREENNLLLHTISVDGENTTKDNKNKNGTNTGPKLDGGDKQQFGRSTSSESKDSGCFDMSNESGDCESVEHLNHTKNTDVEKSDCSKNYGRSLSNSPVTQESEPHCLQSKNDNKTDYNRTPILGEDQHDTVNGQPSTDKPTASTDKPTSSTDKPTPSIVKATPSIVKATPSIEPTTPLAVTDPPSVESDPPYISSPSVIVSYDQSERTETIQSDLCVVNYELRGQLVSTDHYTSETKAKGYSHDSIDSGFAV